MVYYGGTIVNIPRFNRYLYAAVLAAVAMHWSAPTVAQDNSLVIEEILVTAQKREQSLQDVGIAVTAFTSEEMDELRVDEATSLTEFVPNLAYADATGGALPNFVLRGVGSNDFNANVSSPVAVHIDEVYQAKSFQISTALFDIARVEVLKGPQGTLFGRNATGGAINFFTNRPTEEFEAGFGLGYGRFETLTADGYISGPLSENVQGRLSFYVANSGEGQYDDDISGGTHGKIDQIGYRLQLQYAPTDRLSLLFNLHGGVDESEQLEFDWIGPFTPASVAAFNAAPNPGAAQAALVLCNPFVAGTQNGATPGCVTFTTVITSQGESDPFRIRSGNFGSEVDNDNIGGSIRVDYDFDTVTLTSISAFESFDRLQFENNTGDFALADVSWHNDIDQFTQELRLTSNNTEGFTWLGGLFYERDELLTVNTLRAFDNAFFQHLLRAAGLPPPLVAQGAYQSADFDQDTTAFAAFFNSSYDFNDRWRLNFGLRYSSEETEFDGNNSTSPAAFVPALVGRQQRLPAGALVLAERQDEIDDSNVSYRLVLDYIPNDDWLIYGGISTGFKSGGFNGGFVPSSDLITNFDPEELISYEVGFKSTLADGSVRFNGSAFYYDYTDLQANTIEVDTVTGGFRTLLVNASDATVTGAEFDLWWRAAEGLDFRAGIGWLDHEYDDFQTAVGDFSGNEAPLSSDLSFAGTARYEWPISQNRNAMVMLNANYRSDYFMELDNAPISEQEGYWLVNARAAITDSEGRWEVALWGKNLGDEVYRLYTNDISAVGGIVIRGFGSQRTWGGEFTYRFF